MLTSTSPFATAPWDGIAYRNVRAMPWGWDNTAGTSVTAAPTALASLTAGHYWIPAGTYLVSANATVPANVHLHLAYGAKLKPAAGVTITIPAFQIQAGEWEIFDRSAGGTVVIGDLDASAVRSCGYAKATWFGANFKSDSTTDSAAAINAALIAVSQHGTVDLPAGTAYVSNVLIPISRTLKGLGSHRTYFYGYGTSSGIMVEDTASAAKVCIEGLSIWSSVLTLYDRLLSLGDNGVQFGTEGYLRDVKVRDLQTVQASVGTFINGNVVDIYGFYGYNSKTTLMTTGTTTRFHGAVVGRIDSVGLTGYKSWIDLPGAIGTVMNGLEVEAPASNSSVHGGANDAETVGTADFTDDTPGPAGVDYAGTGQVVPILLAGSNPVINGLLISIGSGRVFNHLIRIDGQTNIVDAVIKGLRVATTTSTFTSRIRVGSTAFTTDSIGLGSFASDNYQDYAYTYSPREPQHLLLTDTIRAALTSSTLPINRSHPSLVVIADPGLTANVTISISQASNLVRGGGKSLKVVNNSDYTVFVKGASATLAIRAGSPPVALVAPVSTTTGFPVRPGGVLSLDLAQGSTTALTGQYSGTYASNVNVGGPPAAGAWYRGEVVWDDTPDASGQVGWICVTAGTPGTWKSFGAIAA